jgi:hypothetical protein
MAARAILHKFLKFYFPELSDKPEDQKSVHSFCPSNIGKTRIRFLSGAETHQDKFPTAYRVATTDLATLRTVGLSGRKAEYGARTCCASHVYYH